MLEIVILIQSLCQALPCDADGVILPPDTAPPPEDLAPNWAPYPDKPSFEFTELKFEKKKTSVDDLNALLRILREKNEVDGNDNPAIFDDHDHFLEFIDAIPYGEATWHTFAIRYTGPVAADSPSWKRQTFIIHARDPRDVFSNMISSPEFAKRWDYKAYKE